MNIRIACVPEHFSVPFYIYREEFIENGFDFEVVSAPFGTGDMLKKLHNHEVELGVTLLEGTILKSIHGVLNSSAENVIIDGVYTTSKLCWSIAVNPKATFGSIKNLHGKRVGVSRLGSGSHIMSIVLSHQEQFQIEQVVECGGIDGLINAIHEDKIDFFLWEVITTKPYYDAQKIKMLDTIIAPWPAFVFSKMENTEIPDIVYSTVGSVTKRFIGSIHQDGMDQIQKLFYYPKREDLEHWAKNVRFCHEPKKSKRRELRECIKVLVLAGLVDVKRLEEWEYANGDILDTIVNNSVLLE
jgi:sulfonate transport system substrate-binding protein